MRQQNLGSYMKMEYAERETGDLQGVLFDPKEREELPLEVVENIIAFVEEQVEARLKRGTYFIEAP